MDLTGQRNHYDVLGVSSTASTEELRAAHRQLARVLHPDHQGGASAAESRLAERRMREVNAAWAVLSDDKSRAAYDVKCRADAAAINRGSRSSGAARSESGSDASHGSTEGHHGEYAWGSSFDDPEALQTEGQGEDADDEFHMSHWQHSMVRRGPIVAALAIAAFLFVATAYAGSVGDKGTPSPTVLSRSESKPDCVKLASSRGRDAVRVPCAGENDGHVVTKVEAALDCPDSTTYVVVKSKFLCVSSDPSVVGSDEGD